MTRKKRNFTKQEKNEMLSQLKKEIYRLNIQNEPSRLKYMKMYDKEKALSPTTLMNRLDMSWKEIMQQISLEKNYGRAKVEDTTNMGRPVTLLNDKEKAVILERIAKLMYEHNVHTLTSVKKLFKENGLPSAYVLSKNKISWSKMQSYYNNKYNENLTSWSTWSSFTDNELAEKVRNFISKNEIETESEYNKLRKNMPTSIYLKKRFGLNQLGFKKYFLK